MTKSAGTAESVVMTVRTGIAPETCNSSLGNANLRSGTQAGDDEGSHSDLPRKYVLRHTHNITDHTRPCQYEDWRSQADGFYGLSQSILVWSPYKHQVIRRKICSYKGNFTIDHKSG